MRSSLPMVAAVLSSSCFAEGPGPFQSHPPRTVDWVAVASDWPASLLSEFLLGFVGVLVGESHWFGEFVRRS